jgi:Bifunctional DNA primase/polymerase, N-terminal
VGKKQEAMMELNTNSKPATALRYAARGFFIAPLSADNVVLARVTKNAVQIDKYWRRWPNANIGCHLGKSRLTVIEVKGTDAERIVELLPATLTAGCDDLRWYFYRAEQSPKDRVTHLTKNGVAVKVYGGNVIMLLPS